MIRGNRSGQAMLEYIFLIFFVVMLAAGFLYQFNGAVRNLFNSYFSPDGYLACLIEKGLLPGESNDEGSCDLPSFNLASAKPYPLNIHVNPGGPSAAYAGGDGGSGYAGSSSRANEKGAGGAVPYNGDGSGAAGAGGKNGAEKKLNTGSDGFSTASGLGNGTTKDSDVHEGEGYVPYTGGYTDQTSTVKKKTEVPATPRDLKSKRELAEEKKAKRDRQNGESGNYDFSIGNILKWIAISLLLFAIFFFIGSQITAVSRGSKKSR